MATPETAAEEEEASRTTTSTAATAQQQQKNKKRRRRKKKKNGAGNGGGDDNFNNGNDTAEDDPRSVSADSLFPSSPSGLVGAEAALWIGLSAAALAVFRGGADDADDGGSSEAAAAVGGDASSSAATNGQAAARRLVAQLVLAQLLCLSLAPSLLRPSSPAAVEEDEERKKRRARFSGDGRADHRGTNLYRIPAPSPLLLLPPSTTAASAEDAGGALTRAALAPLAFAAMSFARGERGTGTAGGGNQHHDRDDRFALYAVGCAAAGLAAMMLAGQQQQPQQQQSKPISITSENGHPNGNSPAATSFPAPPAPPSRLLALAVGLGPLAASAALGASGVVVGEYLTTPPAFAGMSLGLHLLLPSLRPLRGVFTPGEWSAASAFAVAAAWELFFSLASSPPPPMPSNLLADDCCPASVVALSGLAGCGIALLLLAAPDRRPEQQQKRRPLALRALWRVFVLVTVPLATVEFALWKLLQQQQQQQPGLSVLLRVPRSLTWLTHFLGEVEEPLLSFGWLPTSWTRLRWLGYWALALAVTVPLAPRASADSAGGRSRISRRAAVVLTRKWFHLVACLLFVPVTLVAPKLQSLSYAIAFAVLAIIECLRRDDLLPSCVNRYYRAFLVPPSDDSTEEVPARDINEKEEDSSNGNFNPSGSREENIEKDRGSPVIISHLALLVGCAAPLWMAEYCFCDAPYSTDRPLRALLSLAGLVTLGVGDASAAVVGVCLGRRRRWWGCGGRRTVEGSIAMLLCSAISCWLLLAATNGDDGGVSSTNHVGVWGPAVAFATLLEAFTMQTDNLVIPVAVATVVLLLRQ